MGGGLLSPLFCPLAQVCRNPQPTSIRTRTHIHCVRAMVRGGRSSSRPVHPFAGGNGSGQLGDGSYTESAVPVAVWNGGTWSAVSAGGLHTCGLKDGGAMFCWGGERGERGVGGLFLRAVGAEGHEGWWGG